MGEERLVLFCSWRPVAAGGVKQQSETDYSFYDTHLEPKLRLSERAQHKERRMQHIVRRQRGWGLPKSASKHV